MDKEISFFIQEIGANEPPSDSEAYAHYRKIFKRSNYFRFNGKFIIVKISRVAKPFFGVGKAYLDLLNTLDDYFLVLLVAEQEGWMYRKEEVNRMIVEGRWNICKKDNQYKINHHTLKQCHWFNSVKDFLVKAEKKIS